MKLFKIQYYVEIGSEFWVQYCKKVVLQMLYKLTSINGVYWFVTQLVYFQI